MGKRINKLYMHPCVACGIERPTRKCRFGTKCIHCLGRSPKNTSKWAEQGVFDVSKDPLYGTWYSMKQRCYRTQRKDYPRYGGRGITVCEEWRSDALKFIQWAKENGYKKSLELDRKYNDGPYSPDNCRWVTGETNIRNSSSTKLSAEKIPHIKMMCRNGFSDTKIGSVFNVHRRTINDIRRGITWADIGIKRAEAA